VGPSPSGFRDYTQATRVGVGNLTPDRPLPNVWRGLRPDSRVLERGPSARSGPEVQSFSEGRTMRKRLRLNLDQGRHIRIRSAVISATMMWCMPSSMLDALHAQIGHVTAEKSIVREGENRFSVRTYGGDAPDGDFIFTLDNEGGIDILASDGESIPTDKLPHALRNVVAFINHGGHSNGHCGGCWGTCVLSLQGFALEEP
jgi:hypothetical protein